MTKQSERATPSRFLAALLCALVVASCGGGGGSPGTAAGTTKPSAAQTAGVGSAMPIASNPSTVAAAAPVLGADAAEVARKLSAGSSEQAKAVDAALTAQFLFARADRIRQVIVFGDSLSDVGTYRVGPIAQVGGGKFTTNPGPVWPETIGVLLGTQVTPFRQGFAGQSQVIGGTGFAMGGSRVSQQPGVGCDLTGAKVIDTYAEFKRVFENPARFHVSVLNVAACDAAKIAMLTGDESGTSLLCSQLTLVQQGAELSYFFADSVHPTTLGHLIVAGFVLTEMWRLRLL
jgi:phospholipase/lecithinase/hemolysin